MLKIVQALINRIESEGKMPPKKDLMIPLPTNTPGATDNEGESVTERNRARTIKELVDTERGYVNALEVLQRFQNAAIADKILSKENIRGMFSNLNDLVDFQRRFMLQMESTLVLQQKEQRIGLLFIQNVGI
jgi:cell division control protein 24